MWPTLGILASYLLGSIPSAYLAGRLLKGIDLRQHGSGNLGATNVFRLLGAKAAVVVLAVDAAKGAIPVLALPPLVGVGGWWPLAFGVAAIAGHVRSVFLLFKGGGKGVATASGVFGALAPLPMLVATTTFVIVLALSGYVSLASLTAAAVLPLAMAVVTGIGSPLFIASLLVGAFVFWTHRANIQRLRRGEENRLFRGRAR